jgi:hydrogenase small subunit
MACTMPGFPDKYVPFMEPSTAAKLYEKTARITHGPLIKYIRERRIRRNYDVEPTWRRRGTELASGYRST